MSEWISVKDRLPDDLCPVNITWINRDPELYYAHIKDVPFSGTGIYFKGMWYWYSCICEDYLSEYGKCDIDLMDNSIEVTHWMPLPEPPEEE